MFLPSWEGIEFPSVKVEQMSGLSYITEQIDLKRSFELSYSPLKVWLLMLMVGWKIEPTDWLTSRSSSKNES